MIEACQDPFATVARQADTCKNPNPFRGKHLDARPKVHPVGKTSVVTWNLRSLLSLLDRDCGDLPGAREGIVIP